LCARDTQLETEREMGTFRRGNFRMMLKDGARSWSVVKKIGNNEFHKSMGVERDVGNLTKK